MVNRGRARGALLGLAVGDALGTTQEFSRPAMPAFPEMASGPQREIVGGGPFDLEPGQVTDDTHMAICLAGSLWGQGRFDVVDAADRYVEWRRHTFDIGGQTAAALDAIEDGASPRSAGRAVWEARGREAAGNGSLMRTAPIGVFFATDPTQLRQAAREDSAITHFDERCQQACVAFNVAIATAISTSGPVDPNVVWHSARAELSRPDLVEDLECARHSDPGLLEPALHMHEHQGFVRVAFRLAFWELLHAPSLEAALIDVINRGGDADTNGAITGALLGSVHGERSIPARWRHLVLHALEDAPAGPLRDVYHPARLLDLVQ